MKRTPADLAHETTNIEQDDDDQAQDVAADALSDPARGDVLGDNEDGGRRPGLARPQRLLRKASSL